MSYSPDVEGGGHVPDREHAARVRLIGALNTSDKSSSSACPDDEDLDWDRTAIATGVLDEVTRRRPIPNQALLLTTVRGRSGPVASAASCNLHTGTMDDS